MTCRTYANCVKRVPGHWTPFWLGDHRGLPLILLSEFCWHGWSRNNDDIRATLMTCCTAYVMVYSSVTFKAHKTVHPKVWNLFDSWIDVLENYVSSNVFTALHRMQTRSSDENSVRLSVCPSVRPSVRHTRELWQNGRKICPDLYTIWKNI